MCLEMNMKIKKMTKNNKLMNSKLFGNRLIITPHIGGMHRFNVKTDIYSKKSFNLTDKKNDK